MMQQGGREKTIVHWKAAGSMVIERTKAVHAFATVQKNPYRTWPRRDGSLNRVEPIAKPWFKPTFRLRSSDHVFTIGSCFARNIEGALAKRGFRLPALAALDRDERFKAIGPSVLNNYSVASIANELTWGLDPKRPFREEDGFLEVVPGQFVDLHMSQWFRPAPLEDVRRRREAIRLTYAAIPECPVIIVTLGLAECWFDAKTGLYIARPPNAKWLAAHPDRFELHVLDCAETIGQLDGALRLIEEMGHPEVRVLLTVSPVPMSKTFRDGDVMVANSYSKAVLRAATEEIVAKFKFAEYFPSFESVIGSERSRAWQDDLVHVQRDLVDEIVDRMLEGYAEESVSVPVGSADTPEELIRQINEAPARAVREIEQDLSRIAGHDQLIQLFAKACLQLRKLDGAKAALALVVDPDDKPEFLFLDAQVAMMESNFGAARRRLESLETTPLAMRPQYWKLLVDACFAEGQLEVAVAAVERSRKFLPRSPIIYHAAAVGLAKAGDVTRAEVMFRYALDRASSWPRFWIDYAKFLFTLGKDAAAREIVAQIIPTHQSHRTELAELARRYGS
jgi:hypothetical protein